MSGGGGGGTVVPQDNSLQLEAMRQQYAREEQARLDAKAAADKKEFQDNLATSATGAKSTGTNYLAQRGLSTDRYGSVIDQIISDTRAKVPNLDPNPGSYFASDMFDSGLNNYQSMVRGNNNAKVQSNFAPGYEKSYIGDDAADQIINEILGTQQGTAQQQIDFQRKRGLLNDSGYNVAEQRLGDQSQAARSTLKGIASAEIGKDRGDIADIVAGAGNAANNWSLSMPDFSIDPYLSQARSKADNELSTLGGDIKSSLGSTQLFDIPSIIAAAGVAQGPQNLTTVDSVSGIPFNNKKKAADRGLGSGGGF